MNVLSPITNLGGGGKGPTAQQTDIANSQQNFMKTLQSDFGTAFAGQQNIINGLTKSLTSTLNAGPSQFGFSQPELTALNTTATSGNAQAYQNARAAAGEAAAAAGGGAAVLPTGSQGETQAELAGKASQNLSNNLLGIQEAGYKQGVQNYQFAEGGLQGAAGLENPQGYAGAANTAGDEAMNSATTIQKAKAAANPWSQVGGLVGSLAGAAIQGGMGMMTGGASSALGGFGSMMADSTVQNLGQGGGNSGLDLSGLMPSEAQM
jgi:hypothetical protein